MLKKQDVCVSENMPNWVLHDDNALPHRTLIVTKFETKTTKPPYSPDL